MGGGSREAGVRKDKEEEEEEEEPGTTHVLRRCRPRPRPNLASMQEILGITGEEGCTVAVGQEGEEEVGRGDGGGYSIACSAVVV